VEAYAAVGAETGGGKHHDGHDPAENRDVAEQGSGARADAMHIVDGRESSFGLRSAADAAIGVMVPDGLSALAAVRHAFLIIITLRFRVVFRQYRWAVIGCGQMKNLSLRWAFLALLLSVSAAPLALARPLEIFFVDVEGGQATLIVSPSGQSLLIDTGWRGFEGRDADRIVQAAKAAKVKQIDYLLITHYHRDHVGGVQQLADQMKIVNFLDHGPNTEDSKVTKEDYTDYVKAIQRGEHMVMKPGDTVPIRDLSVKVLTAAGSHIQTPLEGAGQPNSYCAATPKRDADPTENAQSLGVLVTFEKFRFLDLGDLTWNKELELMCPANPIGTVDVLLVSHHGLNQSNSPALVDAVHPRVAIMNNGARKGASPDAWQIVKDSPSLEDLWQLHYAEDGGKEHNVADSFIANVDEHCTGQYIKLTAEGNGTFTVANQRNKFVKVYKAAGK
jgi:beta-lactamase superfamily II metal-dependent hydrolase